jgi:hypothetical protein
MRRKLRSVDAEIRIVVFVQLNVVVLGTPAAFAAAISVFNAASVQAI